MLVLFGALVVVLLSVWAIRPSGHHEYPVKPITIVIGFNVGGGTDLAGRVLAKELQSVLGVPVLVENQSGNASMDAALTVARSRPDGYTLWFGSIGTLVLKRALGESEVDFFEDMVTAGTVTRLVPAVVVASDSPYQTVQDLIADAQARPGELRWAYAGIRSAFTVQALAFIRANELDVQGVHMPGDGGSPKIPEGIDFSVRNQNSAARFPTTLRVLAGFRDTRTELINTNIPALGELGIQFTQIDSPLGVLMPRKVPEDVRARLEEAIGQAVQSRLFVDGLQSLAFPVVYEASEQVVKTAAEIQINVETLDWLIK